MRILLNAIIVFGLLAVIPVSAAQDETGGDAAPPPGPLQEQDQDSGAGEAAAEQEPDVETVPETFRPLYEAFKQLVAEIRDAGGRPASKFQDVQQLHARVQQFNDTRTPDELSVAVELQLARWSNQLGDALDDVFEHMEDVEINHAGLRIAWADFLRQHKGQHERVIEVLDGDEIDLAVFPMAAIIRAESLVQMNRFDQAAAALETIPENARLTPELLDRIYRVRRSIEDMSEGWEQERARLEAEAQADDLPRVELITDKGSVTIELLENETPNTVANFITLVESGFYDGMPFHQVSPNFQVIAGDPTRIETEEGQPARQPLDYRIRDEIPQEGARKNWSGYVSMVNTGGPNTASGQFRISLRRQAHLDERATVFGRVIEGMSIVRNLEQGDRIIDAEVIRKREHEYEVERLRDFEGPEGNGTDEAAGEEAPTNEGGEQG